LSSPCRAESKPARVWSLEEMMMRVRKSAMLFRSLEVLAAPKRGLGLPNSV
jgi:hypothetical protein